LSGGGCHPLVCRLCREPYEQPCLLDCYHDFCAGCLRGRAADGRLACPLCGHPSVVKGASGLPPVDRLLQFLVAGAAEEEVQCANCDRRCTKAEQDAMYFCNTCSQALCAPCRDETHRARMFARHDVVALAKRTKDVHKKCRECQGMWGHGHAGPALTARPAALHQEPYIMFSTEKKSMLCICCFRDMQGESRAHCIDLETAYAQGCEKLDQAVMAVKELQTATREAIVLLKAMIEEVRSSACDEEAAISSLCSSMQVHRCQRGAAACPACSQHEEKEKALREQLEHLAALLPTLQVHLVTCSAFLSSASKAEFLDLGYQLMERLQKIVQLPHRLRPAQSSKISTEYRAEFARCLEPLLTLAPRRAVGSSTGTIGPGITATNIIAGSPCSKTLLVPGRSGAPEAAAGGPAARKPSAHRSISTKVLLAEGTDSPFAQHCRDYENTYRGLQAEVQSLKDQVQELHRDLTKHHSLVRADAMGEVLQKSLQVDVRIAAHYSSLEMMRSAFEEVGPQPRAPCPARPAGPAHGPPARSAPQAWEETFQRVANEQEIYEGSGGRPPRAGGCTALAHARSPRAAAQLHDLLQLRQENTCLGTIAKQIAPYVRSIAKVKERLEPR
ncbi:RN207 protein, partial [Crypturellus undulatus]|nr:RN207 protein [Crypturellus undulatus]